VSDDLYDLERFVRAQDEHGTYERVVDELRAGRKRSHWMWSVFPQMTGLGASVMSERFAISGLEEARAYLAHVVLGERLRECATLVLTSTSSTAEAIFGPTDAMKLRSSMTLFARVAAPPDVFAAVIDHFLTAWLID
jgi:uncharacterized protein (DUF1810 family)